MWTPMNAKVRAGAIASLLLALAAGRPVHGEVVWSYDTGG